MSDAQIATGTKLEVLRAAHRVVLRDGVSALTLEAVAREAGRSKGGLLYHFPTKEALIQGLIADPIVRFDRGWSPPLSGMRPCPLAPQPG